MRKLSRFSSHVGETIRRTLQTGRIPGSNIRYLRILECDEKAGKALSGLIEHHKLPVVKASVVAGSGYNYRTVDGNTFIKKSRSERMHNKERSFYEYMETLPNVGVDFEENPLQRYEELIRFIPRYLGTMSSIEGNYILLEDITSGMQFPSVIDIKLGRVSRDSNRHPNGVCLEINGAKISGKHGDYLTFDLRRQWRRLAFDEAYRKFGEIFSTVPIAVRLGVVEFLQRLKLVLSDNRNMLVRDSSVLVAWDQPAGEVSPENTKIKLIDFQKADHGHAGSTEQFLAGVDQAISWIEDLQHDCDASAGNH